MVIHMCGSGTVTLASGAVGHKMGWGYFPSAHPGLTGSWCWPYPGAPCSARSAVWVSTSVRPHSPGVSRWSALSSPTPGVGHASTVSGHGCAPGLDAPSSLIVGARAASASRL